MATLETKIRQQSEQQKKAGVELEATCHICLKTKFADGVGHICHYCKIRCCARCGGKVTLRSNKVSFGHLRLCPTLARPTDHQKTIVRSISHPFNVLLVAKCVFGSHRINICYRFRKPLRVCANNLYHHEAAKDHKRGGWHGMAVEDDLSGRYHTLKVLSWTVWWRLSSCQRGKKEMGKGRGRVLKIESYESCPI